MKIKKIFCLILALVLAILCFTGCRWNQSNVEDTETEAEEEIKEETAEESGLAVEEETVVHEITEDEDIFEDGE